MERKVAESAHYEVYMEWEYVTLKVKGKEKTVDIGDFYGYVEEVAISPEENYCVMAGCGIIVYFLEEPFTPYQYCRENRQWREWDRDGKKWAMRVMIKDEKSFVIQMENGEKNEYQIVDRQIINARDGIVVAR